MKGLRAIMVSVDYSDLLAVTLPLNRHHFDEVAVVTSGADCNAVREVCRDHETQVLPTELFWASGAKFNKWLALEWGLDRIGRHGWICLMDADVVWPREAPLSPVEGTLTTPLRRMLVNPTPAVPPEASWHACPVHRNVAEWAGYSQIFHADDPRLGTPPWHETNWEHAGGADSFFQIRWPASLKVRPPWECLHLGAAGENWYGRASQRLDGSVHPEAEARRKAVAGIWTGRRARERAGLKGDARFGPEKVTRTPAPEGEGTP